MDSTDVEGNKWMKPDTNNKMDIKSLGSSIRKKYCAIAILSGGQKMLSFARKSYLKKKT